MQTSPKSRMSPITALFMGIWIVGGVTVVSAAGVVLYGLKIIDRKSDTVLAFAQNAVTDLPALIESLPPVFADLLHDRRAPEYVANIDVSASFVSEETERGQRMRPVLTITNNGSEVVSLLAIRVAALNAEGQPVAEWTQVAATPTAIDDEWRGVLMPNKTRHIVVSDYPRLSAEVGALTAAVEVSELRVWTKAEDQQG